MCKEMPVIPVNRVVYIKRIIENEETRRRGRGANGVPDLPPPPKKKYIYYLPFRPVGFR
jgi:hypothetical protein